MKKNDIFTFTAHNGVEVTAVILDATRYSQDLRNFKLICYAQNRLFWCYESYNHSKSCMEITESSTIADYAILPDYDRMLEDYQHQIDMANDYADKTL